MIMYTSHDSTWSGTDVVEVLQCARLLNISDDTWDTATATMSRPTMYYYMALACIACAGIPKGVTMIIMFNIQRSW